MLLQLLPGKEASKAALASAVPSTEPVTFMGKVPVTLHEPNALLLDMAEFAFDNEPYLPREELLRADNYCRQRLGIPLRKKHVTQPYLIKDVTPTHSISLRFLIYSEVEVAKPLLAGEDIRDMKISLSLFYAKQIRFEIIDPEEGGSLIRIISIPSSGD